MPQINDKRGLTRTAPVSTSANQIGLFLMTLYRTEFRNMKYQLNEVHIILDGREVPLTGCSHLVGLMTDG